MALEDAIIKAIEHNLAHLHPYASWRIGRTADPGRRERELDFPGFWRLWHAEEPEVAEKVEEYFLAKGMKKDDWEEEAASCVYLF